MSTPYGSALRWDSEVRTLFADAGDLSEKEVRAALSELTGCTLNSSPIGWWILDTSSRSTNKEKENYLPAIAEVSRKLRSC